MSAKVEGELTFSVSLILGADAAPLLLQAGTDAADAGFQVDKQTGRVSVLDPLALGAALRRWMESESAAASAKEAQKKAKSRWRSVSTPVRRRGGSRGLGSTLDAIEEAKMLRAGQSGRPATAGGGGSPSQGNSNSSGTKPWVRARSASPGRRGRLGLAEAARSLPHTTGRPGAFGAVVGVGNQGRSGAGAGAGAGAGHVYADSDTPTEMPQRTGEQLHSPPHNFSSTTGLSSAESAAVEEEDKSLDLNASYFEPTNTAGNVEDEGLDSWLAREDASPLGGSDRLSSLLRLRVEVLFLEAINSSQPTPFTTQETKEKEEGEQKDKSASKLSQPRPGRS